MRPRRTNTGMSAILLPMKAGHAVDGNCVVARTAAAGTTPAINMDTGYVQLTDDATHREAQHIARGPTLPHERMLQ